MLSPDPNVQWQEHSASKNTKTGIITNLRHKEPEAFLQEASTLIIPYIKETLNQHEALTVNAVFSAELSLKGKEKLQNFQTKTEEIYKNTNLEEWFKSTSKQEILNQILEFQDWTLHKIINISFNLILSSYIELPESIKVKKACVNVKNEDNASFAWAVTSAIHPVQFNPDLVSSYPQYRDILNLENISFPITIVQIRQFETQNPISINVYILKPINGEEFNTVPVYLTRNRQGNHVNLLLINNIYNNDDVEIKHHYVWIKNFNRLLSKSTESEAFYCERCLNPFHTEDKLKKHEIDCKSLNECKIKLPNEGENFVQFKNYKNKVKVPFVIYADLECLLVPTSDNVQKHLPYSIGYFVKCDYDDTRSFYRSYQGLDCVEWFTKELKQFAEDVKHVFLCHLPAVPLNIAEELELEFIQTENCYFCEKPFQSTDRKIRDHCLFTGKYRGAIHETCNVFQETQMIPIVFHNFTAYDSHFIIRNLIRDIEGDMELLPINKGKYLSFTKHIKGGKVKFRFIDSFRFMASSVDKLSLLISDFPILKSQGFNEEQIELLRRKIVLPFNYIDSMERLKESSLPTKGDFFNKLENQDISDDDYEHGQIVWKMFRCKTLGDYSDLCLKTGILLLAEVFEQFRSRCLSIYKLDPAHYYTLPGYTWDAMLKYTNLPLELLTDVDMLMFIERGIRGGLSQCSIRYSKANNRYMTEYNPSEPEKFLMYYDLNNHYGWAMTQYLPYGGFEWLENVDSFNLDIPDDSPIGYILEVDLEYPKELHDEHSDLPFCPEQRNPDTSKLKKLIATLHNKNRYVIHYRNLKQVINNGLKIIKIHRILKFKQSSWLKSYIDLNTKLRQEARNEFEKNLYKLMNNAVFGKTIENVRKYSYVKLVDRKDGRYSPQALIAKPNLNSVIIDEDLAVVELIKTELFCNKPIYIGFCVLDISKLLIYSSHYGYIKSNYGNKAHLCYTDTDSLIYELDCDVYEIMKKNAEEYFDTSDYPENNIYNIPRVNKKALGFLKDENNGQPMTEFIALKPKMYAYKVNSVEKTKKAIGIKSSVLATQINFEDYLECLRSNKSNRRNQYSIRIDNHEVSTIFQNKIALNPYDDKRFICSDNIHTLPWGHYSIPTQ